MAMFQQLTPEGCL